jgi:hypothetical protein
MDKCCGDGDVPCVIPAPISDPRIDHIKQFYNQLYHLSGVLNTMRIVNVVFLNDLNGILNELGMNTPFTQGICLMKSNYLRLEFHDVGMYNSLCGPNSIIFFSLRLKDSGLD